MATPADSVPAVNGRTFESLGLGPQVLRVLDELGYEEPTPIQVHAISP